MPETKKQVEVLLCADLGESSEDSELKAVADGLEKSGSDVHVEIVPDLCKQTDRTLKNVSQRGVERLVLGLCSRVSAEHEFQGWARRAGLDPYSFELIDLHRWAHDNGSSQDMEEAVLLLKAAVERLQAFKGSDPEQLKMKILYEERKLSRRSLVSLPPWAYEAVPSVKMESCLGHDQCGLCVDACPVDAIEKVSGELTVNKLECKTCGLCQAACPVGAFNFPGSGLDQYEAEIPALLSQGSRGLVIACRRTGETLEGSNGRSPLPAGWLPIEVPCMGAVTPGWILQALAGGASSVALLSCGEYCRMSQGSIVDKRVDYIQEMLGLLGVDSPKERVMTVPAKSSALAGALDDAPSLKSINGRMSPSDLTLIEPAATAEAIVKLVNEKEAVKDPSLTHDASPMGLVRINKETCTTCGSCASFCPTAALDVVEEDEKLVLTYDTLSCVNCGRCAPVCPESNTISVEGTTDLVAIMKGRATIKEEGVARCKNCGRPIAPTAMLNRIQSMLDDNDSSEELVKALTELCSDCRASST